MTPKNLLNYIKYSAHLSYVFRIIYAYMILMIQYDSTYNYLGNYMFTLFTIDTLFIFSAIGICLIYLIFLPSIHKYVKELDVPKQYYTKTMYRYCILIYFAVLCLLLVDYQFGLELYKLQYYIYNMSVVLNVISVLTDPHTSIIRSVLLHYMSGINSTFQFFCLTFAVFKTYDCYDKK